LIKRRSGRTLCYSHFEPNQQGQGAEDEKAFCALLSSRIPSGAEEPSDTWNIAISAKQRNFVSPIKKSLLIWKWAMSEPVKTHFLWRPQLRDPSGNGRADALITFNVRVRRCLGKGLTMVHESWTVPAWFGSK